MPGSHVKNQPAHPNDQRVDELLLKVGERIRTARESKRLPRRVLSDISGVSPRYLAQLESGQGNISIGLLLRVATALDLKMDWLVSDCDADTSDAMMILQQYSKATQQTRDSVAQLLQRATLNPQRKQRVCLIGLRGAGKSTLLQMLGMLDTPSSGEYNFFDEPVHQFNEKKRTDLYKHYIGFVFQAYHLIDDLTVYENIETPLIYRGIKSKERKPMVAELLDRFNIVAKKDLFPEQLSGGQQQLVGLARAIIGKPKLLLADEPTGNLHSKQGEQIMDMFKQLHKEGITIIQVTHSEKNAQYGNRIIQLEDGHIREDISVGGLRMQDY